MLTAFWTGARPSELAGLRWDAEQPLHVDDDAFVFLNPRCRPLDVKVFTQWTWNPALRRLGVRPRTFYATRHTFISIALTRGWNLKALAEYCGTSVAMIERHYGRYLSGDLQGQLALLGAPQTGNLTGNLRVGRSQVRDLSSGEGGIRTLGRGTTPTHA